MSEATCWETPLLLDLQVQRSALHFRSRLQGIEEMDTLMRWDTFHPWIDFHGQVDGLDVQFFYAAGLAYQTSDASSENDVNDVLAILKHRYHRAEIDLGLLTI